MIYGSSRTFGYFIDTDKSGENSQKKKEELSVYVLPRDIFFDKSDDEERPQLKELFANLQSGDSIYFYSLDNLLKNNQQLKLMLEILQKNKISFRVIDIPSSLVGDADLFDMDEKSIAQLAMDIIYDIVDKEAAKEVRANQYRQSLGFARAKSNGIKIGRKSLPFPDTFEEDYALWRSGQVTAAFLYKKYHWSNPTFYRHVKKYEASMVV